MRQSGVAQSYLDPLAVRVQSVRMGKRGRGWKRFLVFAELTKGKKGADYVALFTYFSFEGKPPNALCFTSILILWAAWLRILLAEGPRQVINALTLYSVMQLNLIPTGENAAEDGRSPFIQFFLNVGLLVEKEGREPAVILFSMLFTLVIWVITLINLMVAVVLYLLFLFHHIPSTDGGLSGYCRRKINKSMEKIVQAKVDKALRKENALRARQEAMQGGDSAKRQPTLPILDATSDEKPPPLSRQTTQATLPEYTSQAGSSAGSALTSSLNLERQPTLPALDGANFRPGPISRVNTNASSASWSSYASDAPLIDGASGMGHGPPGRMQGPNRSYSGYSQSMQRSYTPGGVGPRPSVGQSGRSTPGTYKMEPVPRSDTAMSGRQTPGVGPSPISPYNRPPGEQNNPYFPPLSDYSGQGASASLPRSNTPGSISSRSYTPTASSSMRSITPAPSSYRRPYEPGQPPLPRLHTNPSSGNEGYRSYSSNAPSPAQLPFTPHAPPRSFTQPKMSMFSSNPYSQQTSPPPRSGYVAYQPTGRVPPTERPGTAPPSNRQNTPVDDQVMEDIMNGY